MTTKLEYISKIILTTSFKNFTEFENFLNDHKISFFYFTFNGLKITLIDENKTKVFRIISDNDNNIVFI
jgi:hypothetical protein